MKKYKKRVCNFCSESVLYIDYKNVPVIEKYVSQHGKIQPSRLTGTCSKHQRMLGNAIKRARHVALLPFVLDRVRKQ
nr:30S ribosomal protein S18 [Mesomycoplasma neurolyticum]